MKHIHKNALVNYSAEQMFKLVDDIEHYPAFLPWCSDASVIERDADTVTASLKIAHSGFEKSFTTKNFNTEHSAIKMTLVEGPFKTLAGNWSFEQLGEQGCKVSLDMEFEFNSKILDLTLGPVFSKIANTLVDAFIERANKVYGNQS